MKIFLGWYLVVWFAVQPVFLLAFKSPDNPDDLTPILLFMFFLIILHSWHFKEFFRSPLFYTCQIIDSMRGFGSKIWNFLFLESALIAIPFLILEFLLNFLKSFIASIWNLKYLTNFIKGNKIIAERFIAFIKKREKGRALLDDFNFLELTLHYFEPIKPKTADDLSHYKLNREFKRRLVVPVSEWTVVLIAIAIEVYLYTAYYWENKALLNSFMVLFVIAFITRATFLLSLEVRRANQAEESEKTEDSFNEKWVERYEKKWAKIDKKRKDFLT